MTEPPDTGDARPGPPKQAEPLPEFSLPTAQFFGAGIAAAATPGALGAAVSAIAKPDWFDACWLAGIASVGGVILGGLAVRPWRARPLTLWPAGLLLGQMASVGGVALCGLLLYSATRPKAVIAFGLVAAAGFLMAMLAQVSVFDRRQRASTPTER